MARGTDRRRPWARIVSMVMAVGMLPGFPLGTFFGMFMLHAAIGPPLVATVVNDMAGQAAQQATD